MIILASASPRRKELLSLITDDFKIVPADIDETVGADIETEKIPQYLASEKARFVFQNSNYNDIVIGCDTGVFIDGKMLGKPVSEEDAINLLKTLQGRKHRVITGCALYHKDEVVEFSQITEVEFYELSDEEIISYVKTGEPMDKAGAYGIQGKGAVFVKGITGDYQNVVGLPVAELYRKLKLIKNT